MNERDIQQGLLDAGRLSGWLMYHTHDSRRSEPGFPDIVAVRGPDVMRAGQLAFIECKGPKTRVTEYQRRWLGTLDTVAEGFFSVVNESTMRVGIANPDTYDSWLTYLTRID